MLRNNLDFKHIDKIIKKGLKNSNYYRVLGIIGQSEEPITNSQIKQNFEKKYSDGPSNKYIYEILKELSPISEDVPDKLLFIWEDLKDIRTCPIRRKMSSRYYKKLINHLILKLIII